MQDAAKTEKVLDLPTVSVVDVVMPAHNEGPSIGETLREFHRTASRGGGVDVRFVVAEDGSTDDTCEVVRSVAQDLPVRLLTYPERKGYSKAVVDGLRQTTAPLVCFVDSDGQCDPADLQSLLDALPGHDVAIGYRHPRHDSTFRKLISGAFKMVYERLFPVRLHDPSCPYIVVRREALGPILRGHPGILKQGFWWEFNARVAAAGLSVTEVPVHHRVRASGNTQVYRLNKIPRIAAEHLRGLIALRRELRSLASSDKAT
jgi:glycosyltransferase involved in cell wall biosynthesis